MDRTARLGLPLVQPSQAQKHVTVNEGLARLDALSHLTLASQATTTPPLSPPEGTVYAVPAGAVNDWDGEAGRLAVALNGGWDFVDPQPGWRAWIADEGTEATFDGTEWVSGAATLSPNGAGIVWRTVEADHVVSAGPTSTTSALIPANSLVLGVTGRVTDALTGAATSWRLGIAGVSDNRYGAGLGMAVGSYAMGLTSTPVAYYAATPLTLTGEGGDLAGGTVRLAVHLAELRVPEA